MSEDPHIFQWAGGRMESDLEPSEPGWYFWDETEAFAYGPYDDREAAVKAMGEYAETL